MKKRKDAEQNPKKIYDTEFSQGFSIMKAKEFHHNRNEGPRWGCICHGKERKHGTAGIGVSIDILPLEAWEFRTGWLQKIPLHWSGKFLPQFSTPLPPFIAYTTSKVEVNIAFWQSKHWSSKKKKEIKKKSQIPKVLSENKSVNLHSELLPG